MAATANPLEPIHDPKPDRPDRRLVTGFLIVLGIAIAGLLWLSVRADSPPAVRTVLDIFMQLALGSAVASLAFRALVAYPFRIADLLAMVIVLSLALKLTFYTLQRLSAIGLIRADFASVEHFGEIAQTCLLLGSILIAGGAFALRTCHRLRIERQWPRIVTVVSGMLALPAAAGSVTFIVLLLVELAQGQARNTGVFVLLWIVSVVITLQNFANLARSLALKD